MTEASTPEPVFDTVFTDLNQALETARLRQRVLLNSAVTGLQVCYYIGRQELPADAPENLIQVPLDQFVNYFEGTRNRIPNCVTLPPQLSAAECREMATSIKTILHTVGLTRSRKAAEAIERYQKRPAKPLRGKRPRVFAVASRETTVMQHCSRGLLEAFSRLGHQVRLEIETNDMQRLDIGHVVDAMASFDPHIVININHEANNNLPPDVVNVVWWQDPMPAMRAGAQLPWRPNDLVYTVLGNVFGPALERTGLPADRIHVQPFCVDAEIFCDHGAPRQDKVVFVGSSASVELTGGAAEEACIAELAAHLENGEVSEETVCQICARHGFEDRYVALCKIFYYVVRDHLVRWLCRARGARIEVYGRDWDHDPVVAPFFKGELPHGRAVADVYRSAKYALVVHPISINSQRLAEAAACGCIPIVYDCRSVAEPPFWEDRVLYFRTPAGLAQCLKTSLPTDPDQFRAFFSYARFAEQILAHAQPMWDFSTQ